MASARQYLNQYASRRTPWGAPWWAYAVVFAVANGLRQLLTPDGLHVAVEVATFALLAVVVFGVVTAAHMAIVRREGGGRAPGPGPAAPAPDEDRAPQP